jgi:hypothetical protein
LEGRYAEGLRLTRAAEAALRERPIAVSSELAGAQLYALLSATFKGDLGELRARTPPVLREARSRGDLYTETSVRARFAHLVALADGDHELARDEIRAAMRAWSHAGWHLQHFFALVGEVQTDLYVGDGARALQRMKSGFPALQRALLTRIHHLKMEALYLRARSALALAERVAESERAELLAVSTRDANELAGMTYSGEGIARLIHAGVAWLRGREGRCVDLLESAIAELDAHGMELEGAAARDRLGHLVGGDRGRALMIEATRWMKDRAVADPHAMMRMVAPGFAR